MDALHSLLAGQPLLALFLTLALGYLLGKLRIGNFVLGGVAGTLLAGLAVGQFGIAIDPGLKTIFFALFLYAVGYQGGPQFFHSLNRGSLKLLASATLMCWAGLLCVLLAAWLFDLDAGTAAGLAAGALTQSAIIGTAGDAIAHLGLPEDVSSSLQANIAAGYAVCYLFGSIGPIIMLTAVFPAMMRWNIRDEAQKLAAQLGGGKPALEPGQFYAINPIQTRTYRLSSDSSLAGKSVVTVFETCEGCTVERVSRDGQSLSVTDELTLAAQDLVTVTARLEVLSRSAVKFGEEQAPLQEDLLVEESREVVLGNSALSGLTLQGLRERYGPAARKGLFITGLTRMGHQLPVMDKVVLKKGDELRLVGAPPDLDRATQALGYRVPSPRFTDFVFFGFGMALGVLLGSFSLPVGGVALTLGTGGGCLLSGLFFGWLRSTHPRFAGLPQGASSFLSDFGLAVFVAIVGVSAGPQVVAAVRESGLTLLGLGALVTLVPQIVVFLISYYLLNIRNPIELLGCIAGGRSANPGFAALMSRAGNATPVVPFTVTYTLANIWLTLWGPVIVGLVGVPG